MNKLLRGIGTLLCAIVIGAIIGFIIWLFLLLVYLGIHIFWDNFILEENSKILILSICIIGGIVVGICEKYIGSYPKSMEEVLKEFKKTKRVEYRTLPKAIVKIFAVLWFGGTVGPEAALSGIIGGTATLTGEYLKYGVKREKHEKIDTKSIFKRIFEVPYYGFYNFIEEADQKKVKNFKRALYGGIIFFSTIMFLFLEKLDDKVSFITKFSKVIIDKKELEYLIPLFIIGLIMVLYMSILDKIIVRVFKPLKKYKIANAVVGGLILGVLAISLPFVLFSGEHTLRALINASMGLGIGMLIVIGLIKPIASKICINTGWLGGPIFPIMFSGATIGMASAYMLGLNMPFATAIIMGTMLAGVLRNYKISIVLLIFFFSYNSWIIILIASFLAEKIIKKVDQISKIKNKNE
ncbi:MAG: chloride channel protein [Clostridium sp.]